MRKFLPRMHKNALNSLSNRFLLAFILLSLGLSLMAIFGKNTQEDLPIELSSVPSDPSISVPSHTATEIRTNLTITGSTYSGTPAHQDTDWKIVSTNDCESGTLVWSSLADGDNLESINVNSLEGNFTGALANYDALAHNTQYYACMRYRNADGVSMWDNNSFTTEDLANWDYDMTITVTEASASTLNDYQTRLGFTSTDITFSNTEADGGDLRFTDSTGAYSLPHYIADWDTSGQTGVVWVKIPTLSASGNTDIKVYYDDTPDHSIPTTAGDAVFLDFTDEDNFEDWTNGWNNTAYNTFAKSGDWLHVEDNTGNTHRDAAKLSLSTAAQNETSFTVETRAYSSNVASVSDNIILVTYDGSTAHRFSQLWMPKYDTQGRFGYQEGGTNKNFGATTFSFDTTYELSQVVNGSTNKVDYLVYNTSRTLLTSQVNKSLAKGSPTSADILALATGGTNSNMKTNTYFDFIAIREYSSSEPTYSYGTENYTGGGGGGGGAPTVDSVTISTSSGGAAAASLNLTENTTTRFYIHGEITDGDGCEDVYTNGTVDGMFYRTNVSGAESCSADNNDCYSISSGSCTLTDCAGGADNVFSYECTLDLQYYADATDAGTHSATNWTAYIEATDATPNSANASATAEVNSLLALSIPASFDYGNVSLNTVANQQNLLITNTGNSSADLQILADGDMSCTSGLIPAGNTEYSNTSGFTHSTGADVTTSATTHQFDLNAQTNDQTLSTRNLYFKVLIPESGIAGSCSNTLTINAVTDS